MSRTRVEPAQEKLWAVPGRKPVAGVDPAGIGIFCADPGWVRLFRHVRRTLRRLLHDYFETRPRRAFRGGRPFCRVQPGLRSVYACRRRYKRVDDHRKDLLRDPGNLPGRSLEIQSGPGGRPAFGILAGDGIEPESDRTVLVPAIRHTGGGLSAAGSVHGLFAISHVYSVVSSGY